MSVVKIGSIDASHGKLCGLVVQGVVTEVRKPELVTHTDRAFTVAFLRIRDDTGQARVLFYNERASEVLSVAVGLTVIVRGSTREPKEGKATPVLELVADAGTLAAAPAPLPVNIKRPFSSSLALTALSSLSPSMAGSTVNILVRVSGVVREKTDLSSETDLLWVTIADRSGVAKLRLTDSGLRTGQNVLFEELVVASQGAGKNKTAVLRYGGSSSLIAEPDIPEAVLLSDWFAANPRGPVVGGLFNVNVPNPRDIGSTSNEKYFSLCEIGECLAKNKCLFGLATVVISRVSLTESGATISVTDFSGTLVRITLSSALAIQIRQFGESEDKIMWARLTLQFRAEKKNVIIAAIRPVDWTAHSASLRKQIAAR